MGQSVLAVALVVGSLLVVSWWSLVSWFHGGRLVVSWRSLGGLLGLQSLLVVAPWSPGRSGRRGVLVLVLVVVLVVVAVEVDDVVLVVVVVVIIMQVLVLYHCLQIYAVIKC